MHTLELPNYHVKSAPNLIDFFTLFFSFQQNKSQNSGSSKDSKRNDWFNLFAELDPLANPDALGSKGKDDERNC